MKTYAPSCTNCFAVARPMPLLPPVMRATFPSSLFMYSYLSDCEDNSAEGATPHQVTQGISRFCQREGLGTTFAPSATKPRAWLAPIPRAPLVTITVRLSKRFITGFLSQLLLTMI